MSARPKLLELNAEGIPPELRAMARWAPWRAVWNAKRSKWDKVPCHPSGHGLSAARPDAWVTFDAALAALRARPDAFAGVGLCLTGQREVVGIDLDRCADAQGNVEPWAREIIDRLGSYAEISPGGAGVRAVARGKVPRDWTNHDRGIEVYGGHTARFLTFTGHRLEGAAAGLSSAPAGLLEGLAANYARAKPSTAEALAQPMPDMVDDLALPDLASLELPPYARDFLADGAHQGDRSGALHAAAVALFSAGLDEATVLSLLASSPHAMEVALDHRGQDPERATAYLWREHCAKAKAKATPRVASAEDFEDVRDQAGGKPARWEFLRDDEFMRLQRPVSWLIKRVLPRAELGVIYGEPGAGKSFLALDMGMAIARGVPWASCDVLQGTVAYVVAEGASGFPKRLRAYHEHHGTTAGAAPIHLLAARPNLLKDEDAKDLTAALRTLSGLVLVVMDTLAQMTPGADENGSQDMGRALSHCASIAKATGAMVLLVAHPGKNVDRGVRGWSGTKGAVDVELMVERAGEHRALTVKKLKDGEGEGDEYPLRLVHVALGLDAEGEEESSLVVQIGTAGAKPMRRRPEPRGPWERAVLRAVTDVAELTGGATVQAVVEAVAHAMPAPAPGVKDRRRPSAVRALESLAANGFVEISGDRVGLR